MSQEEPTVPADAPGPRQLVVFSLGEEEYALPIEDVHEIIRYTPPRRVASGDRSVRGVISLRGKILAVHDLAVRLGLEPEAGTRPGKIVIVQSGESASGVVVDDVTEVLTVAAEQLDVEGGRGITGDGVDAIAKIDDRLVVVLRPSLLVGAPTRATAGAADRADAPVDDAPVEAAPAAHPASRAEPRAA